MKPTKKHFHKEEKGRERKRKERMGWLAVIEANFVALGPAILLYLLIITRSSLLVIITIAGSLFWTLGWIVTSAIWWSLYSFMGDFDYIFLVWIGVVVSEFLRYFCVLHYRNFAATFAKEKSVPSLRDAALAIGLGFGMMQVCVTYQGVFVELLGPGQLLGPCFLSIAHRDALLASGVVLLNLSLTFVAMSVVADYPPTLLPFSPSPANPSLSRRGQRRDEDTTVGEALTPPSQRGEDDEQDPPEEEQPQQQLEELQDDEVPPSLSMCGVWSDTTFITCEKFKVGLIGRTLATLVTLLNLITEPSFLASWICIVPVVVVFGVSGFLFWRERGFISGRTYDVV